MESGTFAKSSNSSNVSVSKFRKGTGAVKSAHKNNATYCPLGTVCGRRFAGKLFNAGFSRHRRNLSGVHLSIKCISPLAHLTLEYGCPQYRNYWRCPFAVCLVRLSPTSHTRAQADPFQSSTRPACTTSSLRCYTFSV